MSHDDFDALDDLDYDEEVAAREGVEPAKEQIVFLIDAQQSMFEVQQGESADLLQMEKPSCFATAIRVVAEVCKHRIIASANDELAVVFYGTSKVQNSSNFDGVYVLHDLDVPDAQRIQELENITVDSFQSSIGSAATGQDPGRRAKDLKYALWVAAQLFSGAKSKAGKRIFLMTSDADPVAGSADAQQLSSQQQQVEDRAQVLRDAQVVLQLFPLLAVFREGLQLAPFWRRLCDMLADPDDPYEPTDVYKKMEGLLQAVKKKSFRKRPMASTAICIGEQLKIGVQLFALVMAAKKGAPVALERTSNRPLRRETATICRDTGAILATETLDKRRFKLTTGDTSRFPEVIFTNAELRRIKAVQAPGLHLLGFKPRSCLAEHHQLQHGFFVYPSDRQLRGSCRAFTALHAAMLRQRQLAIVSFVRNAGSSPRLAALLAQEEVITDDDLQVMPEGLYLVPLPYADDIRSPEASAKPLPPVVNQSQHSAQLAAAEALVEGLDLELVAQGWDSSLCSSPEVSRHYQVIEAVALDQAVPPVEQFHEDVEQYVVAEQVAHSGRAEQLLHAFRDSLGLGAPGDEGPAKAGAKRAKPEGQVQNIAAFVASINWQDKAAKGGLKKMTNAELSMYLEYHRLKKSGKKAELVARVREHLGG